MNDILDEVWYEFEERTSHGKTLYVVHKYPIENGPLLFSFDKKKIFNYWSDYPKKLTKEQKETFIQVNPFGLLRK